MKFEIKETGWYKEADNGEGYELVARDADELIQYLADEGCLNDLVCEYICDTYDMEDFVNNILSYDSNYMNSDDMIEDFKEHELEGANSYSGARDWLDYFEEGTVLDDGWDDDEEEDN